MPQGLDRGRACSATGERLTTPLVRDRATGELRAGGVGRGARPRRRPAPRAAGAHGAGRGGGLRRRRADQREGLPARQVRPGRARHRQIDYNGRFCMSSAATAGNRAFGLDRGLPFPLADIAQTDVLVLVGANLAETMPPAVRHLDRAARRAAATSSWSTRGAPPTADRADTAPPAGPGHRPGAGPRRCCTSLVADGHVDEDVRRRAHHRLRRAYARSRRRLVARAGRADHRRARPTSCGRSADAARRGRTARHGPDRARRRAARARAPTPCSPGSTWRWRSGMPRHGRTPATAASPGRATARAAASTARRPTSCPATGGSTTRPPARTSPACGA